MPRFSFVKDKVSRKSSFRSEKSRGNPFGIASGGWANAPPGPIPASVQSTYPVPGYDIPPPVYSAVPPAQAPAQAQVVNNTVGSDQDTYALLSTYDTIFLIDDSGSMAGSRWDEVRSVLSSITSICTARDKDGIDIYFLNHKSENPASRGKGDGGYYEITSTQAVDKIFRRIRPRGITPTGTRIESILRPYVAHLEKDISIDPINIIVITDGEPTDDPESIIEYYARKLDKLDAPLCQVGIQFFQIGTCQEAAKALARLDDGSASKGIRDMVDTVTFDARDHSNNKALTAEGILKVVLGGVNRRLDRQPNARGR
ncbi:hypothetical protein QQS21_012379 [Conoideocrella luteorostrata]|uniref:VWFA domain-containing protein n=1 Tax=Conoideocrella luteorostrata TaxID=1105319 RepID=A0AAJ0CBM5_9HYPO|nr:hypothetical protein QQS21_012379 [Conoideocrella luteorostrata]